MRSRLAVSLLVGPACCVWIACGGDDLTAPDPGEIRVVTSTAGPEADPDGYTVRLDNAADTPIASNGEVILTAAAGEHAVELTGVAPNCAIAGEARRIVTVPEGGLAEVAFEIGCAPTVGGLVVTTSTTGSLPDPDGYTVRVGDGDPLPIGVAASLTFAGLAPGPVRVELGGIAPNCQVEGPNPVTAEIPAGPPETVEFRVACRAGAVRWTEMPSGTTADLTNVWSLDGNTAFAVGERETRSGGIEGVIVQRTGEAWSLQARGADRRPRAVWGSGADDVYAAGYAFIESTAWMLHYDGSQWSEVPFGPGELDGLGFESIWGSGPDDIFAVGFDELGPFEISLVYHYDGVRWSRMDPPTDIDPILMDVWGSSPTNVYAVGRDDVEDPSRGVILRYDGSRWISVLAVEGLVLNAVWGSSANDVYAVGFQIEERGIEFLVTGAVWHYDGTRWSPVPIPQVGRLHEAWGTSASDVYVVGDDGVVLRYDGAEWTIADTPSSEVLLGVWGGAPGEVLAVGFAGTILLGTP